MAVDVEYSRQAAQTLLTIDRATARRIRSKIIQLAADPASLANNVRALRGQGDGMMRLRVGDWRVVYTRDLLVLLVLKVGSRGHVYD